VVAEAAEVAVVVANGWWGGWRSRRWTAGKVNAAEVRFAYAALSSFRSLRARSGLRAGFLLFEGLFEMQSAVQIQVRKKSHPDSFQSRPSPHTALAGRVHSTGAPHATLAAAKC